MRGEEGSQDVGAWGAERLGIERGGRLEREVIVERRVHRRGRFGFVEEVLPVDVRCLEKKKKKK